MSTTAAPIGPTAGKTRSGDALLRLAAAAGIVAVAVLVARFVSRDAFKYLLSYAPATFGDFWPRRIPLTFHIAAGLVALVAAPAQVWTGARRGPMALHRWLGRAYVAAIVLGAGSALYLAAKTSLGWSFGAPLTVTALLWLGATGVAIYHVRARRIRPHREWMARSYALTLFFVWIRTLADGGAVLGINPDAHAAAAAWASLAISLIGAELVIRALAARRRAPRPRPA